MANENQQSPEHAWLQQSVGNWYASCAYFTTPHQAPIKVQGSESIAALGLYWTVSAFEADMMGTIIKGHATSGYDPRTQTFISMWVDSTNPNMYRFSGQLSDDFKTLTMTGLNFDPVSGQMASYRSLEHRESATVRTFELFVKPDGKPELPVLQYTYTRKS